MSTGFKTSHEQMALAAPKLAVFPAPAKQVGLTHNGLAMSRAAGNGFDETAVGHSLIERPAVEQVLVARGVQGLGVDPGRLSHRGSLVHRQTTVVCCKAGTGVTEHRRPLPRANARPRGGAPKEKTCPEDRFRG